MSRIWNSSAAAALHHCSQSHCTSTLCEFISIYHLRRCFQICTARLRGRRVGFSPLPISVPCCGRQLTFCVRRVSHLSTLVRSILGSSSFSRWRRSSNVPWFGRITRFSPETAITFSSAYTFSPLIFVLTSGGWLAFCSLIHPTGRYDPSRDGRVKLDLLRRHAGYFP